MYRLQNFWNEEHVDEILIEISIAQERLEKIIKNENDLQQKEVTVNTKIEPIEGRLVHFQSL